MDGRFNPTGVNMNIIEDLKTNTLWRIIKYADPGKKELADRCGDPFKYCEVSEFERNLIVDVGKEELLKGLMAQNNSAGGGGYLFFNNANSHLGVGTSNTAVAASQTNLLGTPVWIQCDVNFPQDNTPGGPYDGTLWQATAGSAVANFAWEEFGLANGNDPGTSGVLFNRRISSEGTKAAPNIWIIQMLIS